VINLIKYLKSRFVVAKNNKASIWEGYTDDAIQLAQIIDCLPDILLAKQQYPERVASLSADRVCNWFLPHFDNPFYGGIMTILRLSEYLMRCHGMKQRILICGAVNREDVVANINRAFPLLGQAEVIILDSARAIEEIPASDYSFATLWTTAYVLLGVQNTGLKFYMVQDFEPSFYPAGSTYAQAELTYRFGFYGIANTESLRLIYERDYGGSAIALRPTIDKKIFYPRTIEPDGKIKKLFYYARPGTPRNGFELAVAALRKIKNKYGDSIEIICAGAGWDPMLYGLGDVVKSIGVLPYEDTGDLYRKCHIGFVMMMTKHPSYLPLELMACGSLVVTNYNPSNTWFLKDKENCLLAQPTASCLADVLSNAIENYDSFESIRRTAMNNVMEDNKCWDEVLSQVVCYIDKVTQQ